MQYVSAWKRVPVCLLEYLDQLCRWPGARDRRLSDGAHDESYGDGSDQHGGVYSPPSKVESNRRQRDDESGFKSSAGRGHAFHRRVEPGRLPGLHP